eukprot:CAMPEP_0113422498 /NCGR_PEP_ID=MMETSP0013_2-20120614/28493_1 /TAXON_ID=2843 ORGANISM="Skeletonema costatum, Strain 1716" /NCGR_SAMPLE_ID=MMETSP0013_2 /ASSEMBLY_ACC=CAM_ASM_000158 /LENGTH=165 /DNA_ID=CAMNT_0000310247 /DNA_START=226 /DNA_END=720 /DNA_ORIENTATION=+ /assembly_acc=CAM_ASM_000158
MMPCWGFGIQARNGRFLSKIRMLHQNHIHLSRRVGPQIHHSLLTTQQQYTQNHLKFPHATIHKSTAQSGEDTISKNDVTEYQTTSEEETIFALSSGGGGASVGGGATAVAVIRMSGPCAFDALRELLSPSPNGLSGGGKLPNLPKARMASLRTLYDPLTNNDSER